MSPKTMPMAPRTSAAVPPRFTEAAAYLRLREAATNRVAHELHAIAHAELAQQVGTVRLDGLLRQVQGLRDLLVGVGLGDQLEHFLLARRERLLRAGRRVAHPLADDRALDRVGQKGVAARDRADRVQQRLVDLALQYVTGRAGLQ